MASDTLGVAQILELAMKEKKREDKIAFLRQHFSSTLSDVIKIALHPDIKFILPEGVPPYTPCDLTNQEHVFYREAKKLYLFLDGGGNHLTRLHREKLFIDMLSNITPRDAELLLAMKDKTLPYGITYDLIEEAFPDMLPPLPEKS